MTKLEKAIEVAKKHSDGHFTLMRFTTNWRAGFETPTHLDWKNRFENFCEGDTADQAIYRALQKLVDHRPELKKELFPLPLDTNTTSSGLD